MLPDEKVKNRKHSKEELLKFLPSDEEVAKVLKESGLAFRGPSRFEAVLAWFDTQDGRLYRKGIRHTSKTPVKGLVTHHGRTPLFRHLDIHSSGSRWRIGRDGERAQMEIVSTLFHDPYTGYEADGPFVFRVISENEEFTDYIIRLFRKKLAGPCPDIITLGCEALRLTLPGTPIPAKLRVLPADTIRKAGEKILKRQALKLKGNARGAFYDLDPEFVHDMRVATRRARFALRMLAPFLGKRRCALVRAELSALATELGMLRDIDVFAGKIRPLFKKAQLSPEVVNAIESAIAELRAPLLKRVKDAIDSSTFPRLVEELEQLAVRKRAYRSERGSKPCTSIAPSRITRAAKNLLRIGATAEGSPSEEDLHRMRIAAKRLRYVCEYFRDLYEDKLRDCLKTLVALQDCLGAHRDATIAIEKLYSLETSFFTSAEHAEVREGIEKIAQLLRNIAKRKFSQYEKIAMGLPSVLDGLRAIRKP
ncbi:MAG: hypothetical protein Kow00107_02760 [Planctomycetota bacterium]